MPQAGSLGGGTFDLNSQSGVMAVLVAARQSALSPAQKNELRDLVFQYSNGGGDVTVRRALEQKIATYGLTPVAKAAVKTVEPPAPPRPYGNTRPSPHFAPVTVSAPAPVVASMPEPVPTPVQAETQAQVVPPRPVPSPAPQPVVAAPTPVVAPAPASEQSVAPVLPSATPAPITPSLGSEVDTALARIRDIKASVNQKVGNPVNLVDIDNAVGREYMVAMLEAMKCVAGNTPGDLGVAMARLETAYAAVETTIAAHGVAASAAAPTTQPEPAPAPQAQPVYVPPAPVVAEPAPPPVTMPPVVAEAVVREAPATPTPPPIPVATPAVGYASMATPSATSPEPSAFRATSLAEDPTPLRTPQDLPDPASLATSSVSGNPLFTKEVDDGLEQLLSEWVIFKKSGLFGTGPRGRAHPLFQALSPLTIPHILANRYEGASPEIRQSITDYMNGWRYEQGIIYEQEETFEHYLRRVIHHIISLQKRRRQA